MKLLYILFLFSFLLVLPTTSTQALPYHKVSDTAIGTEVVVEQGTFQQWFKELSNKQQQKLHKKLTKIKKKMGLGNGQAISVGTGLLIMGIGVLVAILGLAGLGNILITVGIVVLVIGLISWLLAKL